MTVYLIPGKDAVDLSNHSRVSDVVPSPENVSEGEIEQLRAINAQLVAALREAKELITAYRREFDDYGYFLGADNNSIDIRIDAALHAAEKESNK